MIRFLACSLIVSILLALGLGLVVLILAVLAEVLQDAGKPLLVALCFLALGGSATWIFDLDKPRITWPTWDGKP